MKFLEYSIAWAKGEQFEGFCIAIAGFLMLITTFLFWKFGTTVNSKSLVTPSLAFGLVLTLMGIFMVYSNGNRQEEFKYAYQADEQQFIQDEKKRVEDFQYLYPSSLAFSFVCFALTFIAFSWSENATFHAIGVVVTMFGLALIIIDFFSKERAAIYYEQILQELQ